MSEIFSLSQEELQGASTRIAYASEEEFERVGRTAYPALAIGGRFEGEIQCLRAGGGVFWSQLLGRALDPACPEEGSIWIFEDITDRKRSEEELAAHRDHLEELVEHRTAELREAKEQAEAATQTKTVFLASMSHELRTPLNAILGYAQLLRRTAGDPESRDSLQRIHRAGEHLLGLINHVLSLAKIEAGKLTLDLQAFPTDPFFKSIEDMTRVRTHAKGLGFRLEVSRPFPPALVGDSMKLRQVLMNLLGNALKFTEEGEVTLSVERREGEVHFAVSDTGPGLSPGEVAGLFQAFHQTQSGQRATEGTGLGLHISQAMVRLMGGTIEVQSEQGRGSVFSFEIPMASTEAATGATAPILLGLAPGQAALRMLVVDDVEDNRTLLARLLGGMGMEIREAADGLEALDQWEAWQPHAIWMDLRMPRMDGLEAVKRIRAREKELDLPPTVVIALTASVLDLKVGPMKEAGFDDLVMKPYPESELLEKLHLYCGLALRSEAPAPSLAGTDLLSEWLAALDPGWIQAFDRALLLGDRDEALELVAEIDHPPLAEALSADLREFRFKTLRMLIARSSHA